MDDVPRYTDQECQAVLRAIFPQGLAGVDVMEEFAPRGWEASPLVAIFHPSVETLFEEHLQIHRNMESFFSARRASDKPPPPEPTLEETRASYQPQPVEPSRECRELVARCLWDIFSDNHEVFAPDGRLIDLGSFRGSAGFIADFLNETERPGERYDYMDFYMGTIWVRGRAELSPVYRMIFARMRRQGLDWVYFFPRLGLVDFRPLRKQLEEQKREAGEAEFEPYSPADAYAAEEEERQHDAEVQKLRDELDEAYRESVEQAREQPPPPTVQAYGDVYGHLPKGWPPEGE